MTITRTVFIPLEERNWTPESIYAIGYEQRLRRLPYESGPHLPGFPDTGCDLEPACLSCRLPACRYDLPNHVAGSLTKQARIRELEAQGMDRFQIADALSLSVRAVQRQKAQMRKEATP